MADLDTYLKAAKLTNGQFAAMIGVSAESVRLYRIGRMPRPTQLRAIQQATGGAVTANDFAGTDAPPSTPSGAPDPAGPAGGPAGAGGALHVLTEPAAGPTAAGGGAPAAVVVDGGGAAPSGEAAP